MKTFKVLCEVHGVSGAFQVHVGRPAPGFHPLKYQAAWLWENHQGRMDRSVMKTLAELLTTSRDVGLSFEILLDEIRLGSSRDQTA